MALAYLVAAAFAVAAAFGAADYPKLPYWRRWDPGAVALALATIYSLYALTGLAVAGLADHLDWKVLDSGAGRDWANGAAYGVAAVGILRLEITSFGLSNVSPARILLKLFLARFDASLDAATTRAVPRAVGDLRPLPLCQVSWQLFLRHVSEDVPADIRVSDALWLREIHAQALTGGDTADSTRMADALEAQARLRYYVETLILDNEDWTIHFPD